MTQKVHINKDVIDNDLEAWNWHNTLGNKCNLSYDFLEPDQSEESNEENGYEDT